MTAKKQKVSPSCSHLLMAQRSQLRSGHCSVMCRKVTACPWAMWTATVDSLYTDYNLAAISCFVDVHTALPSNHLHPPKIPTPVQDIPWFSNNHRECGNVESLRFLHFTHMSLCVHLHLWGCALVLRQVCTHASMHRPEEVIRYPPLLLSTLVPSDTVSH